MKNLILLLSLFIITSCNCHQGADIEDITWQVIELNGAPVVLDGQAPINALTFTFNSDKMEINGRTECNTFFGPYELADNNVINIMTWCMTRMTCPYMKYEQLFVSMLDITNNYQINNNILVFLNGKVEIAKFKIFETVKDFSPI